MKFDNENDLKVYQDAKGHRDYLEATAEQTAGEILYAFTCIPLLNEDIR